MPKATTNQFKTLGIFFIMPIFIFLFLFTTTPSQASQCELLNSSDEVQTGFGAAYNTLSTAKETLITADCAVNSANITIGSGQTTQYVYKYGYFWKNNQWEQIEFIPTGAVFDVWFVGKANINIPLSSEELAQDNFLVVYICSWTGTTWKCGCRDAYCATNYWQLQKFKYENNNVDLKEHGEMCFNENDCANNLFCVESARYGIEEQYCCYDGECAAVIPTQGDIPTGVFNCVGEGGIDEKDTLNGVEYYVCQGGDWLLNVCQDSDNDGYDNCNIGDTGDDGKTIDCDDSEYWVNPNGRETCDTVDNNCNGTIDEDCDNDNDGYCNQEMTMYRNNTMCPNTPFISNGQTGDDCDDSSKAINPGAAEICDGFDNNCNNQIDEGCVCVNNKTQPCGSDIGECQKGTQTCINGDWGACIGGITPQTEICGDIKDNDCDNKTDCDDLDCSEYPDCAPADNISPQITVFNISPATINTNEQITINYTATDNEALSKIELWQTTDLNGLPNDSNWTMITSKTISGTSASGNFTDSIAIAGIYWYGIHVIDQAGNVGYEPIPPSSVKVIVNQTTICQDSDDDGYDNCAIGKIGDDGKKIDCDDNEYWANPNGTETCDTIDNDCDNQIDENCDNDNDGYCNENMFMYRNNTMCPNTSFIFSGQTGDDCDDINSSINPGITEICGNGIDEDCDGILDNGCTCTEDWICADWSDCVSGMQTRTCMDNNNCGTTDDKPEEEQVCLSAAITDPNDGLKVAQDGMRIDCQAIALGGTGSYSYEWRDNGVVFGDNQNWQSLDPLTMNVGNHIISVQITDANSSVANDNITIEIVSAGTLTAQIQMWQTEFARDPKTQAWFAVQANGGTGPYTFIWHSDIEGDFSTEQWPMIDVSSWALGTHIITVAVTDNSAIPLTATDMINIEIVDMSLELFSPMEGDTFYLSENVHFHAVAQGGTQPYNYQWKSDEADISTEAFFQKDDLSLGLRTITVTVTDSSIIPLSITKQAHINIIPAPALTISITSPADNSVFDYNESISFRSTTEGGVGPYNYNWKSNIDDQLNTNEIFTKSDLSIGNHTITVTVNDKSGQTSAKFINITVNAPAPPTAVISGPANNSIFTQFDDTIIFQGSASGGTAPYTYKWSSNNDGDLDSAESFMKNDLSVNSHIITFSVTDANNTVDSVNISLTVNARVAPNNAKQLADYPAKIMFLISDENWQDVMGLVPLTTWTAQNSAEYASCKHPYLGAPNVCVYPSLIYHKEAEDTFDADSILYFIDQYNPTKIIAINNLPAELTGAINGKGLTPDIISPSDYLSYWQSYGEVVYVENNYELALLASTYASLRNAPLIIQGSSLDAPSSFSSKKVYTVGTVVCPGSASQCVSFASKQDLEDEYFDSTATDKVVLVNLGDLVITINGTFSSNYCSNIIQNLASKLSLSAPFLASAKHELIISTIKTNFNEVDTFLENKISGLPYMPEFLTIIASPNAIDMQYHNQIAYGSYPSTDQWHYARMNDGDDYLDLAVGRIVGASVSDVSGTIARTIFYQETLRNPDRLHVGHGMLYEYDPALVYSYGQVYSLLGYDATVAPDRTSSDDWKNEFYIQYHDHGGSGFAGILSGQIPKLDNTFILTTACLTCNFKICEDNWGGVPFCGYAMRKGAVGYFGSVDTSTGGTNVHSFITDIFTDQLPVGKAFQNSKNLRLAWYPVSGYANMPYETLIGDPTFILNTDYNFPPADFAITEINPSEIKYKITVPAVKVEIPQNIKDACVHPENVKPFYITSTGQCSCYNPMYPERVYFKIPYVQGFNPTQITSSNASILDIKTQNEKFYFVKLSKTREPYFFSTASETAFTDFDITFTLSE